MLITFIKYITIYMSFFFYTFTYFPLRLHLFSLFWDMFASIIRFGTIIGHKPVFLFLLIHTNHSHVSVVSSSNMYTLLQFLILFS